MADKTSIYSRCNDCERSSLLALDSSPHTGGSSLTRFVTPSFPLFPLFKVGSSQQRIGDL
jgi:hypothetical protein